jgi:hypothetical protein
MAASGGKEEKGKQLGDVFDPFGFLNDFIDQLAGCCQPNSSANGLGRGGSRQACGDFDAPSLPLRGMPDKTPRGRGSSITAVATEGKVGQRTLGEVPSPDGKFAPLVKPGVHIVMPSEAVGPPKCFSISFSSQRPCPPLSTMGKNRWVLIRWAKISARSECELGGLTGAPPSWNAVSEVLPMLLIAEKEGGLCAWRDSKGGTDAGWAACG